jgi:hypothetical protein
VTRGKSAPHGADSGPVVARSSEPLDVPRLKDKADPGLKYALGLPASRSGFADVAGGGAGAGTPTPAGTGACYFPFSGSWPNGARPARVFVARDTAPIRAGTICSVWQCPALAVPGGDRCQTHRRQGGAAWRRLREPVIARAGGICESCGRPARLEAHHGIPLVAGGVELCEPGLLAALCRRCQATAGPTGAVGRRRGLA